MDPILIGAAVSVVSYTTDSTALVPSWNVCWEGNERNKVGVRDFKNQGVNKKFLPASSLVIEIYPEMLLAYLIIPLIFIISVCER